MRTIVRIALTLAMVATVAPANALTTAEQCTRTKLRTAAQYAGCLMKKEAYAVKVDREVDFTFCESRFAESWQRAETDAAGQCPTSGDQDAVRAAVRADVEALGAIVIAGLPAGSVAATGQTTCYDSAGTVIACAGTGQDGDVQAGVPAQFVDNGDGTVSDLRTGLMWEKLSDDGSAHDLDNPYTWTTAVTDKAATLNAQNFAGHNDWRLPKLLELQGLANYGAANPSAFAAFNNGCAPGCTVLSCSCTESQYTWSSSPFTTSFQLSTGLAWLVHFGNGLVYYQQESNPYAARLVRGAP